jgi:hypothetical protein
MGELCSDDADSLARLDEAGGFYEAALKVAQELRMAPLQAQCLYALSRLHYRAGNPAFANQLVAQATALCREMGMRLSAT